VKIAAYQAPLLPAGSIDTALARIREQIDGCESQDVRFLCCPEAILGGLADDSPDPATIAIDADRLDDVLASLASDVVTTIVGFTEISRRRLYNAAAVLHRGRVVGVYRKLHPAINRSVYSAGNETPVFTIDGLTFGIVVCRDSTFAEPARTISARGASVLFVPTNNGLPRERAHEQIACDARACDIARAVENGVWVIRADVAGRTEALACCGSSAVTTAEGKVVAAAQPFRPGIVAVDVRTVVSQRLEAGC
jgi:predicted amidohydrolase